MKKIKLKANLTFALLVLLIVISKTVMSQPNDMSIRDLLLLETYAKDPEAEAMIVHEIGETKFVDSDNYRFELYHVRKCRVKVFSEAGLSYANISIPLYYSDMHIEQLIEFKAKVYNLEDGVIKVSESGKKDLFEEKVDTKWIRKKIELPGVKVGSVLEYEYTTSSPFLFNLPDWNFQYEIPVVYSECRVLMIPFYNYTYISTGITKFDKFDASESTGFGRSTRGIDYREMVYTFVMKDMPAFRDIDFISSSTDYMAKIDFQLAEIYHQTGAKEQIMSTWPKLITEMDKHANFGGYIKKCKSLSKKELSAIGSLPENPIEKLEKLVQHVKHNHNWNGRNGYLSTKSAKSLAKERSGNAADLNLYLVSMLREAGLNAYPLLISTRGHGRIHSNSPFMHFFNYVLVATEVNGRYFLSDATEPFSTFEQIPVRCINDVGLVINKTKVEWINTLPLNQSVIDNTFMYKFNEATDSLECLLSFYATGYDALQHKTKYQQDGSKYLEKEFGGNFETVTSMKLLSDQMKEKQFRGHIAGVLPVNKVDNYVLLRPFLNFPVTINPFDEKKRDYAVEMIYARKRNYKAIVELPVNATLLTIPKGVHIDNDEFAFDYDVNVIDQKVIVTTSYTLKKVIYEAKFYIKLKALFDDIIKTQNESLQIKL